MNEKVLKALRSLSPPLCVMSTVSPEGKSESALLAFVVNENLSLLLSTHHTSRKWKNIEKNNAVALVFGLTFGIVNVQYEGVATLVSEGEEFEKAQEQFFTAHPELKAYRSNDTGFIKVSPTWIRSNDYTQSPPKVEEQSFS